MLFSAGQYEHRIQSAPVCREGCGCHGGRRGIGRNIAKAFGREGAFIAVADIDEEKGNTAVSELRGQGVTAEFLHVDLSRRGEPQAMVRNVAERFGRLDVLINNARSGGRNAGSEEDEDAWELVWPSRSARIFCVAGGRSGYEKEWRGLYCEY